MIEVEDVRRAGHFGQQARRPTRPADETVPLRRTCFIHSCRETHSRPNTESAVRRRTFGSVISVIFLFSCFRPCPLLQLSSHSPKPSGWMETLTGPCCEGVSKERVTAISIKLRCPGDGSAGADVLTGQTFAEQLRQRLGKQANSVRNAHMPSHAA